MSKAKAKDKPPVIISNPADRQAIDASLQELVGVKATIRASQDTVKKGIANLSEKYGIPKKDLRKLLGVVENGVTSLDQAEADAERIRILHDNIYGVSNPNDFTPVTE